MKSHDFDYAVIGSGFGGSVSALRLSEKGYKVAVFEAGRRFADADFPKTNWRIRDYLWAPAFGMRGIQRVDFFKDIQIVSGAGVGGGSLVYANTLYEPLPDFFQDKQWADITDWKEELAPHYQQAKKMLGVVETPIETPADSVIKTIGRKMGVENTYHKTPVGVLFAEGDQKPGQNVGDPFFGGNGPDRQTCIECGGCMVGCRHNAKNTLVKNYLHLAERLGAQIIPEAKVVDVIPLQAGGYQIITERAGAWLLKRRRKYTVKKVVFSAAVLGTLRLLFSLQQKGRIPNVSNRLGQIVRTNSEAIYVATARHPETDYSKGIAITSSIHPNERTHIEPCRYPAGSNSMGLLITLLPKYNPNRSAFVNWLTAMARSPLDSIRVLSKHRWSEKSIILLVMQSFDNSISFLPGKRRTTRLRTGPGHGEPSPKVIKEAYDAAAIAAEEIDGYATSSFGESVGGIPMTAHILGGCSIGDSSDSGVVDAYQRIYGHPDFMVCDGSAISANLGVNPSLTITAMTERAMSFVPNKGDADTRPDQSQGYQSVSPVAPNTPAVPRSAPAALLWA